MIQKELKEWIRSERLGHVREAVRQLKLSGIVELLRGIGGPTIIDNGANPHVTAAEAARANGYQQCLRHILYFEELFVQNFEEPEQLVPDFCAEEEALKRGYLTKGDLKR